MKKAALTTAVLLVMVLTVFGCRAKSTSLVQTSLAPAAQTNPGAYVVIGSFTRRDQVVTVKSGPDGAVYSIAGKDGKVLFENLTTAQLKDKTPELYESISTGTGGLWAGQDWSQRIDASIR